MLFGASLQFLLSCEPERKEWDEWSGTVTSVELGDEDKYYFELENEKGGCTVEVKQISTSYVVSLGEKVRLGGMNHYICLKGNAITTHSDNFYSRR